ncbi:MAG: DUF4142 domain-containing protein [Pedobacter sp.]|nr:DUF4142 domain-containing protein [Pedobacter sp.]MDQ8052176.1 DUF4142 domain-containing protein [Pedobacter sp.]
MKTTHLTTAILIATALAACNRPSNPTPPEEQNYAAKDSITANDTAKNVNGQAGITNEFATKAAIGGMMEVESSADIIKSTENPDVQTLATIMVKDHGMANLELAAIAKKEGIALPIALPKEKADIKKKMDGNKDEYAKNVFYADLMVKEHQEAIDLFAQASAHETNAALKAFATKKLPILKHHLMETQHVLDILKSIKGDKGNLPLKQSKDNQH